MKKTINYIIFLFFISTSSFYSFSQVTKLKTENFSYTTKGSDGKWKKVTETVLVNYLITINFEKERITIYSDETEKYDIIKYLGEFKEEDGDLKSQWKCVDEKGKECIVELTKPSFTNNTVILTIKYENLLALYKAHYLD